MVIVQIIGGLGNQMFQYAAGRALALDRGIPLKLDISGFASYRLHQGFELQRIFNAPIQIAAEPDIRNMLSLQSSPRIRRVLQRNSMAALRRKQLVVEPHFQYWPGIIHTPQYCYIIGFWQSDRYFSEVTEQIREDFSFRSVMSVQNSELAEQIKSLNAVSLHVRRGDYANNPKAMATHGVCDLDYYLRAIQNIAMQVRNPHFFVFSDDIEWVRRNLQIDFPRQYVSQNQGAESYNDMRLMSLCRHHIIANSSFSWWGAWLSHHHDKRVIAPAKWFADASVNTNDVAPEGWIRL
jgi:Glycosyl transferase family 11.